MLLTDFLSQNTHEPRSLESFLRDLQWGGVKEHEIWRGTVWDGRRRQELAQHCFCFHSIKQNTLKPHTVDRIGLYTQSATDEMEKKNQIKLHKHDEKGIKWVFV